MTVQVPFLDLAAMHAPLRSELNRCWAHAFETSSFIGGSAVEKFESEFAPFCGVAHCVGVANGTDALELALVALGIGSGDDVVLPANTFVATAEAVVNVGARPVFADVDASTLLVTVASVAAVITVATVAVIVVHLFGQPVDGPAMRAFVDARGLWLIEDAAQAHGARWDGVEVGSFGHVAAFSFYPGKNLGAFGDGGAVVTDDAALATTVRSLANHGRSPEGAQTHALVGRNSRLDALQASVLATKLSHLSAWNAQRCSVHAQYLELLAGSPAEPVRIDRRAAAVHHLEVVRVPDRARVIAALTAAEIGHGVHYPVPCHRHPPYAAFADRKLPVAEAAAREILSLPMYPTLRAEEVEYVCDVVRRACDGA